MVLTTSLVVAASTVGAVALQTGPWTSEEPSDGTGSGVRSPLHPPPRSTSGKQPAARPASGSAGPGSASTGPASATAGARARTGSGSKPAREAGDTGEGTQEPAPSAAPGPADDPSEDPSAQPSESPSPTTEDSEDPQEDGGLIPGLPSPGGRATGAPARPRPA